MQQIPRDIAANFSAAQAAAEELRRRQASTTRGASVTLVPGEPFGPPLRIVSRGPGPTDTGPGSAFPAPSQGSAAVAIAPGTIIRATPEAPIFAPPARSPRRRPWHPRTAQGAARTWTPSEPYAGPPGGGGTTPPPPPPPPTTPPPPPTTPGTLIVPM